MNLLVLAAIIPVKTGIQSRSLSLTNVKLIALFWIPTFVGMTRVHRGSSRAQPRDLHQHSLKRTNPSQPTLRLSKGPSSNNTCQRYSAYWLNPLTPTLSRARERERSCPSPSGRRCRMREKLGQSNRPPTQRSPSSRRVPSGCRHPHASSNRARW